MRIIKLFFLFSLLVLIVGLTYYCITMWKQAKRDAYIDLTTQIVLEVSYSSPFFFSKNSVGNEWEYAAKVNENMLKASTSSGIETEAQSVILIAACAQENDILPDVGCNEGDIKVSSINLIEGSVFELLVDVTENRGRYSGNIAKVPFRFNFRRIVTRDEIRDKFWEITKAKLITSALFDSSVMFSKQ